MSTPAISVNPTAPRGDADLVWCYKIVCHGGLKMSTSNEAHMYFVVHYVVLRSLSIVRLTAFMVKLVE